MEIQTLNLWVVPRLVGKSYLGNGWGWGYGTKLIIIVDQSENSMHTTFYRSASLSSGGIEGLVSIKNTYNS